DEPPHLLARGVDPAPRGPAAGGGAGRRPSPPLLRGLGMDRGAGLVDALRRDHLLVRATAAAAGPARRRPRRSAEPARRLRRSALGGRAARGRAVRTLVQLAASSAAARVLTGPQGP